MALTEGPETYTETNLGLDFNKDDDDNPQHELVGDEFAAVAMPNAAELMRINFIASAKGPNHYNNPNNRRHLKEQGQNGFFGAAVISRGTRLAKKRLQNAHEKRANITAQISVLVNVIRDLKADLDRTLKQIDDVRGRIAEIRESLAELMAEKAQAFKVYKEANSTYSDAINDFNDVKNSIIQELGGEPDFYHQIEYNDDGQLFYMGMDGKKHFFSPQQQERYETAYNKVNETYNDMRTAERNVVMTQEQYDNLKALNDELQTEYESLVVKADDLRAKIADAQGKLDDLQRQLDEVEAEIILLEREVQLTDDVVSSLGEDMIKVSGIIDTVNEDKFQYSSLQDRMDEQGLDRDHWNYIKQFLGGDSNPSDNMSRPATNVVIIDDKEVEVPYTPIPTDEPQFTPIPDKLPALSPSPDAISETFGSSVGNPMMSSIPNENASSPMLTRTGTLTTDLTGFKS